MRRIWRWTLVAMLLGCLAFSPGCKIKMGEDTKESDEDDDGGKRNKKGDDDDDDTKPAGDKGKSRKKRGKSSDKGNDGSFVYKFEAAKTEGLKPYEALFQHGRLKSLVEAMSIIGLPRDVPVAMGECGEPNAAYFPQKHLVIMCYELADLFYKKFLQLGKPDQEASDATLNALTFVLLHEMGHAVIGELDLGVTGGEEDAVDDLAALILIDAKQPAWAADGAVSMKLLGEGGQMPFHDEHSLGEQRYYNILCVVFGSAPDDHMSLVEKGILPKQRAVRCPTEYKRKDKAWTDMLKPHLRKD